MLRQLVIFDLNGVLGRKVVATDAAFLDEAAACGAALLSVRGLVFLPRPGAFDLVRGLLHHNIDVAIWSSMSESNVIDIARAMMGPAVFSRLAFIRGSESPTASKRIASLPVSRVGSFDGRIVIVDDTLEKISSNPASQYVVATPFDGNPTSADIGWTFEILRDVSDRGIRLPVSIAANTRRFFDMCSLLDRPDDSSRGRSDISDSVYDADIATT
jgi:hypothetical protein